MNETMYRIYKGGTILDPNTNKINKSHQLIKHTEKGSYYVPLSQHLLNDSITYGLYKKIRLFYKDNVLLDYLLSDEEFKLNIDEKIVDSTIMHIYYNIFKMNNECLDHKTILFNVFACFNFKSFVDIRKDWNVSHQYIYDIKLGKQNISNNLKTKIANYFNFDVRLFDEDYFYSLIDK